MKYITIHILLFGVLLISCEERSDLSINFDAIAESEEYHNYRKSVNQNIEFIKSNSIDFDAIKAVSDVNGEWILCSLSDSELASIINGSKYRDLDCQIERTKEALMRQFPDIGSLSKDHMSQIRRKYKELN